MNHKLLDVDERLQRPQKLQRPQRLQKLQRLQRPINYCHICNAPVRTDETICKDCKEQLDGECFDSHMARCPLCRYPKVAECYECDNCKTGQAYEIYSVARYDGSLSYSVLDSFKFHGHKEMAQVVAFYLSKAITALDQSGDSVIVPIPCSSSRLRLFGWDQMDEVCKALGRPYRRILKNKEEARIQQKKLNKAQRLDASTSRFDFQDGIEKELEELKGKRIIVVDDIVTTMSTMNSAIGFLKDNGFKDVCGASWLCEL